VRRRPPATCLHAAQALHRLTGCAVPPAIVPGAIVNEPPNIIVFDRYAIGGLHRARRRARQAAPATTAARFPGEAPLRKRRRPAGWAYRGSGAAPRAKGIWIIFKIRFKNGDRL